MARHGPASALLLLLLTAGSLLSASVAVDVRGSIAPSAIAPLSPDSTVVLDGGLSGSAYIRADGSFVLRDVPQGQYVLSVQNRQYGFPRVAVSVPAKASPGQAQEPVEVRSFKLGHVSASPETVPTLPYPIILQTTGPFQYYEAPKAFSITGLIQQNKMILFMVLGLGFAIGMPKLLAMIDPEALKEVQQSQAEMHKNLGMAQNMDISGSLSKFLAGANNGPAETQPQAQAQPKRAQGRKNKAS